MKTDETIIIGVGELEDPMPEEKKTTKYWIFAGPCEKCGCGGQEISIFAKSICLICEECCRVYDLGLDAGIFFEISYVYWCNRAKFTSDRIELSPEDTKMLEEIAKEMDFNEIPRWAVVIISGICSKTSDCINHKCLYNSEKVERL